ncbi:dephospho-CoA kinase domain-containing protein isoform X2 [Antechinus flavipes]|uniref:dephospho-CoA kinase domain-containing protein isoform X2 n=1 Tax=Antechinus flavipes TaxID=38775 RepID=UPI002235451A|nr:dephospho-CoA kinase domain-containing protein isoform X2 [Antechinus flavipes]
MALLSVAGWVKPPRQLFEGKREIRKKWGWGPQMEVSFISSSGRRSPPASFVPVQASAVEQAATARPPLTVLGDLERSRVWRVAGDGDVTRDLAVQSRILPPAQLDPSGCTSFFLRGPPRTVIKPGYPAYYRIVKAFGHEILLENGEINRQALGSIIFHQSEKRKLLNAITHPEIRKEMLKQILKYLVQGEIGKGEGIGM